MANTFEIRNGSAQKLMLACSMALTGLVFMSDVCASAPPFPKRPHMLALESRAAADETSVAEAIASIQKMHRLLDDSYAILLSGKAPAEALQNHPFETVSTVLNRGFQELKPLRGTGELGPEGDNLIAAYAEARRKAERNAHLIRQMTVQPTVFQSSIDRTGLVALAQTAAARH